MEEQPHEFNIYRISRPFKEGTITLDTGRDEVVSLMDLGEARQGTFGPF